MSTPDEAGGARAREPHNEHRARALPGVPALIAVVAALVIGVVLIAGGSGGTVVVVMGIVLIVAAALLAAGLVIVAPNESSVLILFGRYIGTLRESGLWWVNPFTILARETMSLRVRNFQSDRIKVNDARGNPIEIAAVVVWRVTDTAKAMFDVEDYRQFVVVQSETAVRHLANQYPYDDYDRAATSLRGNTDEVRASLQVELQSRLERAGIEILETR